MNIAVTILALEALMTIKIKICDNFVTNHFFTF